MSDVMSYLFETNAIRFCEENKPFWYTSGKIGPYFINTHFVYGSEKEATELLSFIDDCLSDKLTLPKKVFDKTLIQYNNNEIYKNIEHTMKQEKDTVYLILTDLLGGSVNNQLLELCTNKNVYVIAGANLGMLLELYLADDNKEIRTIIKDSVEASKQNIRFFGYPINDYVDHKELMEVNLW